MTSKKENEAMFSTFNFYGCSPITSSIEERFFKFDLFERLHYTEVAPCVGLELVTIQGPLRESHGYEVNTHNFINQI